MPIPLGQMTKTFDLDGVEEKEFFPHMYNKDRNLDRILPQLPPKEDYLYKSMKPDKKMQFEEWYAGAKDEPFSLREALASYCCSDVSLQFRS
jgi:hypothetical protein